MSDDVRRRVIEDLGTESADLDRIVAELDREDWQTPTPAPGWTIAHQVAHLAWTDEVAVLAATEPEEFAAMLKVAADNPDGYVDEVAEQGARARPPALLARWRTTRAALDRCLRGLPEGAKIAWFGPPMRTASMATARLMETWAHGLDIADALGVEREPTARLRHVAHLGVRTRGFAYLVRELDPPEASIRVELTGPGGELWTWGPEDAEQRVVGPALDFCLLVTQRRHVDDLSLVAAGADAEHWLRIAQAFAGPPGAGREPEAAT
ncbi:MAG: TIGR03084 family metal-binding protein [Nocardioidaceae bacterium]